MLLSEVHSHIHSWCLCLDICCIGASLGHIAACLWCRLGMTCVMSLALNDQALLGYWAIDMPRLKKQICWSISLTSPSPWRLVISPCRFMSIQHRDTCMSCSTILRHDASFCYSISKNTDTLGMSADNQLILFAWIPRHGIHFWSIWTKANLAACISREHTWDWEDGKHTRHIQISACPDLELGLSLPLLELEIMCQPPNYTNHVGSLSRH